MKLKTAILYRIDDAKKSVTIFYIVILSTLLFTYFLFMPKGNSGLVVDGAIEGLETASIIFLFVVGLNSFKEPFRFFMQNGTSRKTMFKSYLCGTALLSLALSVIDRIINILSRLLFAQIDSISFKSMFHRVPGIPGNGAMFILTAAVLSFFVYATAMMLGYLITTMYYRMNKTLKLIVSIGVPGFFFLLLPTIDLILFKGALYGGFYKALTVMMSSFWSILAGCIFLYAVFAALSWTLMRKAVVKD